ncbi:MAG: hypothetical protein FJ387_07045 [Verrucomicrobia bacterium]|nr:hypothetical protein [Verrucomicrobiota bacterium]
MNPVVRLRLAPGAHWFVGAWALAGALVAVAGTASGPLQSGRGDKPPAGPVHRLPDARAGEPYEYFVAVQGLVEPIQYRWTGSLPQGLKTSGARCWGTPVGPAAEAVRLNLTVTDALTSFGPVVLTGRVGPAIALPLQIATEMTLADIPDLVAVKGCPFAFRFAAVGGVLPYRMQVEGAWPDGLSFDARSNRVFGVPERTGRFALRLKARDSSPSARTIESQVNLTVLPAGGWDSPLGILILAVSVAAAIGSVAWGTFRAKR